MQIFKNNTKDLYLVISTVVLIILPFIMANLSFTWWIVLLPLHAFIHCLYRNSAQHYHGHWGTFKNKKIDDVYSVLTTLVGFMNSELYRFSHAAHHIHVNDKPLGRSGETKDHVSIYKGGKKGQPLNYWIYCFKGSFENLKILLLTPIHVFKKDTLPSSELIDKKQYVYQKLAIFLYPFVLMCVNVYYGLWFFLLMFLVNFFDYSQSYGEHWGAYKYRGDTTRDSVGIYDKWYNFVGFNCGYHQEHHHKPGVHWTQLPKITPLLHPDRIIRHGTYITAVPAWDHFKQLFGKNRN
jgi:hypothetical protein